MIAEMADDFGFYLAVLFVGAWLLDMRRGGRR